MKYTKQEILDRLSRSHSWKETQLSVEDVYSFILNGVESNTTATRETQGEALEELRSRVVELSEANYQLTEKVKRLSDTNKQLRSENKSLRASR